MPANTNTALMQPKGAATTTPFEPVKFTPVKVDSYQPVTAQVGDKSLVKTQLNDIIDPNSALMKRAKTRALQQANKRGLLNSSMAVGASEAAMIDAATPIAMQDAKTQFAQQQANQQVENKAAFDNTSSQNNAVLFNAENKNKALMFNADKQLDAQKFDTSEANQMSRFNKEQSNTMSRFGQQLAHEKQMTQLEGNVKGWLAQQQYTFSKDLDQMKYDHQTVENLDSVQGNIYQQMIAGISDIARNPDMSSDDAKNRIQTLVDRTNESLKFVDEFKSRGISQSQGQSDGNNPDKNYGEPLSQEMIDKGFAQRGGSPYAGAGMGLNNIAGAQVPGLKIY